MISGGFKPNRNANARNIRHRKYSILKKKNYSLSKYFFVRICIIAFWDYFDENKCNTNRNM